MSLAPGGSTGGDNVGTMSECTATSALRMWSTWATVGALAVTLASLIGLGDTAPNVLERSAFTVIPFVLLAAVLCAFVAARQWLIVGAVALATSSSVLAAMAAGDPAALLAALAVSGGLGLVSRRAVQFDPGARSLVAAFGLVALAAAWAVSTPARIGVAPTWHQIVAGTGATVRHAVVGVGADGGSVALASLLIWVLAAGVLFGLSTTTRRAGTAAVLPASVVTLVVGSWAIERWRGPVEAGSAMWILAGGVVAAAAAQPTVGAARCAGRGLAVLAALSLSLGTVHQVRRADGSDVRLVLGATAAACVGAAIWWASRSVRPRGVNVIATAADSDSTVRTLVAALDAAGSAVGVWAGGTAGSSVFDTTLVVGAAGEIASASAWHRETVGGDVRLIGMLTEQADPGLSIPGVDELWVTTPTQRDALATSGTHRVRVVALPVEPRSGWSHGADSALLKATGRDVQRVIGGWAAAGSRFDGDPSE